MVFGKVHCFNCNAGFEIYTDDVSTASRAEFISCPHCGAVIPPKAATKIHNAFKALSEVNSELKTAHDVHGANLFQASA